MKWTAVEVDVEPSECRSLEEPEAELGLTAVAEPEAEEEGGAFREGRGWMGVMPNATRTECAIWWWCGCSPRASRYGWEACEWCAPGNDFGSRAGAKQASSSMRSNCRSHSYFHRDVVRPCNQKADDDDFRDCYRYYSVRLRVEVSGGR